jgi:membrane-associated protein
VILHRRTGLLAAGALAVVAGAAAVFSGAIELPDLEAWLTDLSETLGAWTYALVGGLAFLETGAFVGLVAPGETAVVLGGVVAERGDVDLVPLLLLVWLAAATGDPVSFLLGRRLGTPFLSSHGSRIGVTPDRLERVEGFVERHGPKAVLVGRFVGIIRAVAPFLAGATHMPLRRFLPWSLLGTALWATLFTMVGYVFWRSFSTAADTAARGALALAVLAAAVAGAHAYRSRRRRRTRLVVAAQPC